MTAGLDTIGLKQLRYFLWWKTGLLLLLAGLAAPAARAQILDDSTKLVYGPKTTRLVYEDEVLRDSTAGTPLDTTLTRWSQARFWFHDTTFQQDLGTVGSASRRLLYEPNLQLGARFGRNAFDKYARDGAAIPYYDSRSPYSFFRLVQSGAGEQVFEFGYTRSLGKRFSIGANYERFASNKILGAISSRDGLVEHSNLMIFGRYQSENDRYHLLFNIGNARHRAIEQGGIWPLPGESRERPQDLFGYETERIYLTQAQNQDDRDQIHALQTYRLLGRGLTLFHVFDARRQYNSYFDAALTTNTNNTLGGLLYYPRTLHNNFATIDRSEFRQLENTVGVLGRTDHVEYRLYARRRDGDVISQTLEPSTAVTSLNLTSAAPRQTFGQVFLGGTAAFTYRKIYSIQAAGEYKLFDEYWLRAAIRTGPISAEIVSAAYSPTLTQQQFAGNHYEWHFPDGNALTPYPAFNNTKANQLTVRIQQRLPGGSGHLFEASGSAVALTDLIYYNQQAVPEQLKDSKQLLIGFARHRIHLGKFGFDNQATYTVGGDGKGLRIPSLVTNSRVYYESYLLHKALFSQIGFEVYYQSRFRAYDYSPSTQQFYVQDHFTIRNYAVADVFFVADIKAVSVFLKMAYINEGILHDGYFTTPYYTGYPRRFTLGLKWNFFN